jgi:SAM-dependent methyltransferase
MATRLEKVRIYYASFDEWSRLDSAEGSIEFRNGLKVLKKHLKSQSRVLDLGGEPGRYAAELVGWGHRVVLADVSPELLSTAQHKLGELGFESGVESYDEIDAVDLSRYEDRSFDAVLAFGPFYHLTAEDERAQAAREIHRVLKPEGTALVAYMPRASGVAGLIERAGHSPEQVTPNVLRTAAETGIFQNASDSGFQEGYFALPREMRELFKAFGFQFIDELSLKSIVSGLGDELAALDPTIRDEVDRLADEMCRLPEVITMCGHAVVIFRKV